MRTLTRQEARRRAELLEVASYEVTLDLTQGEESFTSTVVVRFSCREPGASTFLELDGELVRGTLDGAPLALDGNRIVLDGLAAENEVTVVARCRYSRSGEGLHRFVDPADGRAYLWAQSFLDDAQRLFACFDQPDLKARFDVRVTAPPEWTVVLNGRASRTGDVWSGTTERISTYLFHLSAGPWHAVRRTVDGRELGLWCRASLAEHLDAEADELFAVTAQSFAFQERLFGRAHPFGGPYDQLFVPEFNHGAMENPGAVTFTEDFLPRGRTTEAFRRKRAVVVAHEMAHMWFGDLVTMRWWDGLWLNESFAELLGFWTVAEATRFDGAWLEFCAARKAWGYRADAAPTTHPVAGEVADNRAALLDFDGISYAKGASVLRQLSVLLGPDVFFAGVRRYLDDHAWGNTTLIDLLAALEAEAGRDLSEWARTWLRTTGTSVLRPVVEDGAVTVVQEGPVLREHRTAVGRYLLQEGRLVRQEPVPVDVAGARTPTAAAPADLLLLNDGDLTFARTRFDDRSLATVQEHLGALDDPLARALCVASLWDALRDGELAAAVHVRALTGALAVERDAGVVEMLAAQARTAAATYEAPDRQDAALAGLAGSLADLARAAEPGGDLQLVLVRAWAATASDAGPVRALLQGGLPGLVLDADLRWHLLRRLAALGGLSGDELAVEAAQDRTASGERSAAHAAAARPDAAAKAAAWRAVTRDPDVSNHRAAALAAGLWQRGQEDLLEPYVDRYCTEVEGVWAARSPELAGSAARLLFPSTLVRADVLARVDALLGRDLAPGLRRVVLEQRDDLARALAGQRVLPPDAGRETAGPRA